MLDCPKKTERKENTIETHLSPTFKGSLKKLLLSQNTTTYKALQSCSLDKRRGKKTIPIQSASRTTHTKVYKNHSEIRFSRCAMTSRSSTVSTPVNGVRWRLKEKKRVRKTARIREQRQRVRRESEEDGDTQGTEQNCVERDRSSVIFIYLLLFFQFCDLAEVAIIQKKI
jgi:hypothetical protein